MMRGFGLGNARGLLLRGGIHSQPSKFQCTSSSSSTNNSIIKKDVEGGKEKSIRDFDVYKQVENLDFMTAAKILFTTPPKEKKFGIDFHLVQLFFVCMPSLAVYLVAQYARYEIKRMEAEEEVKKKKAEEVEMAKEMEELAHEEERRKSDPELLQVKARLDALEETLKVIVVETKKPAGSSSTKEHENTQKEEHDRVKTNSASNSEDSRTAVDKQRQDLSSQSLRPSPSKPDPVTGDQGQQKS